ncbi:MAG: hypothetical protein ACOCVR_02985, partial [Myxococcota bacterium]
DELFRVTRGRPLLVLETLEAWVREGLLQRRRGRWSFRGEALAVAPPRSPSGDARPASIATMERARDAFGPHCEIIAERMAAPHSRAGVVSPESVEALVGRRPCTLEGIASGLGAAPNEVIKLLDELQAAGVVRAVRRGDRVFFEKIRG